MNQPSGEIDLDDFLVSSPLCDSDNLELIQKAQDLTNNLPNDKEKAIKIFYFIRDKFLYKTDPFFKSASDTLQKGYGDCVSKSHLQIAILRAIKIPARFHIIYLKFDVLMPFFPRWINERSASKVVHHSFCECFLNGKWIACDCTFDKMLLNGARSKGLIKEQNAYSQIDWDGEHDLELLSKWKIDDGGTFTTIDENREKVKKENTPPRFITNIVNFFINRSINKVRKE